MRNNATEIKEETSKKITKEKYMNL